jgi:hypothetical protein
MADIVLDAPGGKPRGKEMGEEKRKAVTETATLPESQ